MFSELDAFLDSLTRPKSFGSVSLSGGNRLFTLNTASDKIETERAFLFAPAAGYYHKSGIGVGGSAAIVMNNGKLNPYQYLATVSYDYLKVRGIATGVAFTRFFTEDNLAFYTSPLQNEVSGYFIYRKSWLKPSLTLSYGWGSRSSVEEQEFFIEKIRKNVKALANGLGLGRGNGNGNNGNGNGNGGSTGVVTRTQTTEKFYDYAVSFSLRHDFYLLHPFLKNDNLRVSPQITANAGTQRFGLNQTTQTSWRSNSGILKPFTSDQVALEERSRFKPLSLTAFLRTAYTINKWYVQPQLIVDYYLPETSQPWNTSFMLATGLIF